MSLGRKPGFLVYSGVLLLVLLAVPFSFAKDKEVRIPLPKRSHATPVQNLNREGVRALEKHDYDKAKKLFYQAYLLDPNDPFTLNNLGYVAELEGDVDRAQRFYALAGEQTSDARVDRSTTPSMVGKPVAQVAGKTDDIRVQVNRYNVEAIGLLMKDRAPEADMLLHKALALDRRNPFTLNNLGFAEEKEGEYEQAQSFYSAAAATGSNERIVVTPNSNWRGKPIAEIASENARQVRRLMSRAEGTEAKVARLNLRGVSAINRNERDKARQFFQEAYRLDPNDSFTLNNMGYLAEMEGDQETADFYYQKATDANHSNARVEVATRRQAQGERIAAVADQSSGVVASSMQMAVETRRRQGGPIVLRHRDNTPVTDESPAPSSSEKPEAAPPTTGGAASPEPPQPEAPSSGDQRQWTPATRLPSVEEPKSTEQPQSQPQSQPESQPNEPLEPPAPPPTQQTPPPPGAQTPQ